MVHPRTKPLFRSAKGRKLYFEAYEDALTSWPVPTRRRSVATRFGSTHVIESGDEMGDVVLLLPGSYGTAVQWAANVQPLVAAGFRVVAADLINDVGYSSATLPARTSQELAEWVAQLIAALGGQPVHLVGMSYGGWVALAAALRSPRLVRDLVLIDPIGLEPLPAQFFLRAIPLLIMPARRIADRYLRWFLAPTSRLPVPFARMWELGWRYARPSIAAATLFTDSELTRLQPPTLVLIGERDPIYRNPRAVADGLAKRMPTARAHVVTGAGHLATVEQPALVNALLRTFFLDVEPENDRRRPPLDPVVDEGQQR